MLPASTGVTPVFCNSLLNHYLQNIFYSPASFDVICVCYILENISIIEERDILIFIALDMESLSFQQLMSRSSVAQLENYEDTTDAINMNRSHFLAIGL